MYSFLKRKRENYTESRNLNVDNWAPASLSERLKNVSRGDEVRTYFPDLKIPEEYVKECQDLENSLFQADHALAIICDIVNEFASTIEVSENSSDFNRWKIMQSIVLNIASTAKRNHEKYTEGR